MNQRVRLRMGVFALAVAFLGSAGLPLDAEARRMGSGGNVGRSAPSYFKKDVAPSGATNPSRTAPNGQQATNSSNPASNNATAAPRNRFLGPLAGLAAGLGLAALFSHLGLGAGMAEFMGTLLMIGAVVFAVLFLVRMWRRGQSRHRPAYSAAGAGSYNNQATSNNNHRRTFSQQATELPPLVKPANNPAVGENAQTFPASQSFGNSGGFNHAPAIAEGPVKILPPGFDEAGFLNSAKKFFVTLQGLYDKGDLVGLREYCTNEVIDQLRAEIELRGNALNRTDVVTLNAELISFETEGNEQIACVEFTGMLREEQNSAATELQELWVMSRPIGGGWLLSGIHNS